MIAEIKTFKLCAADIDLIICSLEYYEKLIDSRVKDDELLPESLLDHWGQLENQRCNLISRFMYAQ